MLDRHGPTLWNSLSDQQVFLTTILAEPPGNGNALSYTNCVPDLHHLSGRGGRVFPLYRDSNSSTPNESHELLRFLQRVVGDAANPENLFCYIAGVLAHPGYTERFHDELEVPGPRVPLTKDPALFQRAVGLGMQVIAWQTYAERFPEAIGTTRGRVPSGAARLETAIPDDPLKYPQNLNEVTYTAITRELKVGEGLITNVDPRIWQYQVSGLRVVRSWLGYRMKERSGRKSSPLDDIRPERWTLDMSNELMELLWVLEGVIALEPAQNFLLAEIVAGPLFLASELPTPTDAERQPPKIGPRQQQGLGGEFDASL